MSKDRPIKLETERSAIPIVLAVSCYGQKRLCAKREHTNARDEGNTVDDQDHCEQRDHYGSMSMVATVLRMTRARGLPGLIVATSRSTLHAHTAIYYNNINNYSIWSYNKYYS